MSINKTKDDRSYQVKSSENGRHVINLTIKRDVFDQSYEAALKQELKNAKRPGFRKGKVPREVLEKDIKDALSMDVLNRLIPFYVQRAIEQEGLQPIAPPRFSDLNGVTEPGTDITFTVEVVEMPDFELGPIEKITVKTPKLTATENELAQTIENIKKQSPELNTDKVDDKWAKKAVKLLGLDKNIKTLADLKKAFKKVIKEQKQIIYDRQNESHIIEEAIKLSGIHVPHEAVEYEMAMREEAFRKDIQKSGSTVDEVLGRQGRTIEQLREMWHRDAHVALERDALLKVYAQARGIKISQDEIDAEVEKAKKASPQADSKQFESPQWQNYIRSFLLKQKAYESLIREVMGENEKEDPNKDKPAKEKATKSKKSPSTAGKKKAKEHKTKKDKKK